MKHVFVRYTFLLVLAGIAITSSSFQTENLLSRSQNLLKKTASFQGKFTLAHTPTGVLATGQGSHIGSFTLFAPEGENTSTITAANGDQIFTTYTVSALDASSYPMVDVTLAYTITGGTGRFAGATGSFDISAHVNENIGRGDGTLDGTINY